MPAVYAQEEGVFEQLEVRAALVEPGEEEGDELIAVLQYFRKHPLHLNTASAADLQSLHLLTDLHIAHFLRYRSLVGPLISIYELQAIPTWDLALIARVLPFVTVGQSVPLKTEIRTGLRDGERYVLLRSSIIPEKQKGFDRLASGSYVGSRPRLLLRYRYTYKNSLQYGLTAEKDSGEPFFKGAQRWGFDFYSGHFFARDLGPFTAIAVGDFTANMGQGLLQWQTLAFGKGSDVINVKRQSPVLKPYTGSGEYAFNRGLGATIAKGSFAVTAFLSAKKISGNHFFDTASSTDAVSSLLVSGLYRTRAELENRYNLQHTSFGTNVQFRRSTVQAGLNAVHNHLSKSLKKDREPYNRFALQGSSWLHYSADYGVTYGNSHFFGEVAVNGRSLAVLGGVLVAADPKVDLAVVYRAIGARYESLWGNAFTEASLPSNEKGIYTGITLRATPRLTIAMYADHFFFPFIKSRINAPSAGRDYMMQVAYVPSKSASMYLRLRSGTRQGNAGAGSQAITATGEERARSLRFQFTRKISSQLSFKSRADMLWTNSHGEREEGFLLLADGNCRISRSLAVNARILFFDADGFNSRLYAYESDVFSAGSVLPFYNTGMRYYGNLSYSRRQWTFWVRWAQIRYHDVAFIGSGGEAISGNTKSEIKVQLRCGFD
jgi:hypothetical protein